MRPGDPGGDDALRRRSAMAYRRGMRRDRIGLQLHTVRDLLPHDLDGTLRAVAAAGYSAVELAPIPGLTPERLRGGLADAGLAVVASHEPIERLRDDPLEVARRLARLGCGRAVVPTMPAGDRATVEDVRRFARELGRLAGVLGDRGLRLGYHNHAFEFEPLGGTTGWQVLATELPPEVELEIDVYWLSVAGRDPVAEVAAAGDRVRLLHVKDRAAGPLPLDAPPGQGIMDIPSIVEAGRAAGVEWYIAELVDAADPAVAMRSAATYLRALAI
jgi:sugar phosphate isomerase/epimerase